MDSSIILFFDLFGTMIFAITGAVKGIRNRLDLLGVLFFAVTVGCGGGMIRDALIGSTPVAAFNDYRYFLVCIIAGIVCFIISPVYVLLHNLTDLNPNSLLLATAVFTTALRIIGYRHHFKLPVARLHGEEKRR